jgi:2-desacetyl-2-hydroxyethyl bacteriochlorophyllide A dehydrogenase
MRQIVLQAPGQLVDRRVPSPARATGEALVRIRRVGVCGTDFHAFAGTQPIITYPRVLGHEIACEVIDAPANDRGIQPGDRCAIEPYISCRQCRACRLDRPNCCERLHVLGVHVDGAMQTFLAVPIELLHKSDELSLDQLALVETLGIGAHAVARSGIAKGEDVLVIGAGPIGLSVWQFARAEGAVVRVVEKSESRRAFAERFGADVLDAADGRLADAVFDATGSAASMAASLQQVAPAGRLTFVGICKDPVPLDDPLFHTREVTLHASRNSRRQFPRIIRMIEEGRIDTGAWITDRVRLSEVPRVFADLRQRTHTIKAMIDVDGDGAEE